MESILTQACAMQVEEATGLTNGVSSSSALGKQEVSLSGEAPTDTFLHTRTVGLQEVRSELSLWKQPEEELEALFERTKACRRTTELQVQQWIEEGITVHVLPGKAVCTRKAGVGKAGSERLFVATTCLLKLQWEIAHTLEALRLSP